MPTFQDPPIRTAYQQATSGFFSWAWTQWFLSISKSLTQVQAAPTITGSRGGNVALEQLLTALDTAGIISDETTP